MSNKIIPYDKGLKLRARELRKNQTQSEKIIWSYIRKKQLGVEFHRQVPMLHYIVDFYCHEIGLAIEIDGKNHDDQILEDGIRSAKIEEFGVRFLRFRNDQVFNNISVVINQIKVEVNESLQ